jgi:tetratricopeptide (TPR) repeat protein
MGRFRVTANQFGCPCIAAFALVVAAVFAPSRTQGQSAQQQVVEAEPEPASAATLQGIVRDSDNHPVTGATVRLQAAGAQSLTVRTDAAGAYRFSALRPGVYVLRAQMSGYSDATASSFFIGQKESRTIDLTLNSAKASGPPATVTPPAFFDEPHFTVAGVTDTTNLGGHGSDTVVRNREALAQATASLSRQLPGESSVSDDTAAEKSLREALKRQPESFGANYQLGRLLVEQRRAQEELPYLEQSSRLKPTDFDSAYELALAYANAGDYEHARANLRALLAAQDQYQPERAEPHHLLGDVDEKLGNPLEAVKEYQRAAELNPSESNLFDWGSELLVHRAVQPAVEVFATGSRLFPRSVRMLAGLGATWYALGSYDQAAQRLCEASDLNPDDPTPYLFMGKMQTAENAQSEAIVERLARFVALQPENGMANYYYAVSLWKRRKSPESIEDLPRVKSLLEKAISLDPKLGAAYLQLGILYSERKDLSKAISAYQHAIAATPRLEEAHYRLAQAYRQAGETSKAQVELQLYSQISKEREAETERQRHELQQFVYQLRETATPSTPPQ